MSYKIRNGVYIFRWFILHFYMNIIISREDKSQTKNSPNSSLIFVFFFFFNSDTHILKLLLDVHCKIQRSNIMHAAMKSVRELLVRILSQAVHQNPGEMNYHCVSFFSDYLYFTLVQNTNTFTYICVYTNTRRNSTQHALPSPQSRKENQKVYFVKTKAKKK